MAMTAAERKRLSRERKKKELERAQDKTLSVVQSEFSSFLDERILELEENLDSMGLELRGTSLHDELQIFNSDGLGECRMSSLERATGLAGVFIDAAQELHELINEFKLNEISARISEIEESDLSDPSAKKSALEDIVQLRKIQEQLDREFRRSFHQIEVKE